MFFNSFIGLMRFKSFNSGTRLNGYVWCTKLYLWFSFHITQFIDSNIFFYITVYILNHCGVNTFLLWKTVGVFILISVTNVNWFIQCHGPSCIQNNENPISRRLFSIRALASVYCRCFCAALRLMESVR